MATTETQASGDLGFAKELFEAADRLKGDELPAFLATVGAAEDHAGVDAALVAAATATALGLASWLSTKHSW